LLESFCCKVCISYSCNEEYDWTADFHSQILRKKGNLQNVHLEVHS
jgi:hypothetical protein